MRKFEYLYGACCDLTQSGKPVLTIKHKNRALSTMASADRFAEIVEEQIPEIINEADTDKYQNKTKQNTFATTSKFVDFRNARFENCNFAFTYNVSKKSD